MNNKALSAAVKEAKRFIALAAEIESCRPGEEAFGFSPSKETSAVKRASMDLTRALTVMRRPN
jgi:hypothetical protein